MHELKKILTSKRELGLILLLFLIDFIRGAFFLTFLPLYAVNFLGISVAATGLAVSAHFLGETLCKGAAGWQLDRRGYPVLILGLLIGLVTLLIMKHSSSPAVLVFGSAALGLAVSPVWLAVVSVVAPVQYKERATRMGLVFAVWLLGGIPPCSHKFFIAAGFNEAFWLLIILWCALWVVTMLMLPRKNIKGRKPQFSFWKEVHDCTKITFKKILLPGMFADHDRWHLTTPSSSIRHEQAGAQPQPVRLAAAIEVGRLFLTTNVMPYRFCGLRSPGQ